MFELMPQKSTIDKHTNILITLENEISHYSYHLAELPTAKNYQDAHLFNWNLLRAFIAYDKEQRQQHSHFCQKSKRQDVHHWTVPYFKNVLFELAQTTSTQGVLIKKQLYLVICMNHQTDSTLKASRMRLLTMIKSWIQLVEQRCNLERQLVNALNSIETTPCSQNDSG